MRGINRLSALKVNTLRQPGYYADGGGLYLRVAPGGSKGWIFRFALAGRMRDAGLGAYPTVSLRQGAQAGAALPRNSSRPRIDPIEARKDDRAAARSPRPRR